MTPESKVITWHQFQNILSEDNGINSEEEWYEPTLYWISNVNDTDSSEDNFLLDDKATFLKWGRENNLLEPTLAELLNEDISSINIVRLLSREDIDELKIPLRQKYAMTQAIQSLNNNASPSRTVQHKFQKQKTYSVIERISEKSNTKLSKSRSERITKVEKMNIWKRWKKPSTFMEGQETCTEENG